MPPRATSNLVPADVLPTSRTRLDIPALLRRASDDLHARRVEAVHRYLVDSLGIDDTDVATAMVRIVGAVR